MKYLKFAELKAFKFTYIVIITLTFESMQSAFLTKYSINDKFLLPIFLLYGIPSCMWYYCFVFCYLAISCRDPGTPANGDRVLTQGTTVGSIVTYECNRGYVLKGADSRVCQPDGVWSAALPSCNGQ